MTRITLDVPAGLARALEAKRISESQARQIALAALELCARQGTGLPPAAAASEARQFARRVIEENRALFEELARR